jgi:pyruvate, water dikinase
MKSRKSNKQSTSVVRWFADLTNNDVASVGGKNASLGEMIRALKKEKVRVPDGFATTAEAYWHFLEANELKTRISGLLKDLREDRIKLEEAGHRIRQLVRKARFPEDIQGAIQKAYAKLSTNYDVDEVDVAVRSSATAEDLPDASFAGQQETFLNVKGEDDLLEACLKCYASLFTDRAISYREEKGFDHMKVALSVGVQKMVRSDKASSGVMFSIDTETGFPDVVVINGAWGLGENVVKGAVNPDAYLVFKPLLDDRKLTPIIDKTLGDKEKKMVYAKGGSHRTKNADTSSKERSSFVLEDEEVLKLARWACVIEKHYEKPMDMEWAKDGDTGELFIVQARPETVQSQRDAAALKTYRLKEKGEPLLTGLSIGQAIGSGPVRVIDSPENAEDFNEGDLLVTQMTDPDWVPIMRRAAGIITETGGRTCHAAIVSRELGVPAVVGTGDATHTLKDGQPVTLSCAEGDEGHVYDGRLDYEESEVDLEDLPKTRTRIMMNIASPAASFRWWRLPCDGIGLARMEFLIGNIIRIHPLALTRFDELEDKNARRQIERLTRGYEDKSEYFVERLARGIAKIAAPWHPQPVIVRLSDFKTNEYAGLIGGTQFEEEEANPMLGFRGASRYTHERYQDGFALECRALQRLREELGFKNIVVMVPFCRTIKEADEVLKVMSQHGLERGKGGLEVYVMCEIPSNVILAAQFSERFDGFSIGSNDLTQLVLGIDRDSTILAPLFDERDEAVKEMIRLLIRTAHKHKRKVGICGQAPSDHPEFAAFLVEAGIDSMSLNPDSVIGTIHRVAKSEHSKSQSSK